MRINCFAWLALLCLLVCYCPTWGQSLFTLIPPKQSGITFKNRVNESQDQNVLTYDYFYNGGGVAVGDLNNDGLPDIVLISNMDDPKIYLNKGNFRFEDVTRKSGVEVEGWKTGVTLADVNGDGWLDIYICRSGNGEMNSRRNLLYINQHDGTFKEEAGAYGIDDPGNTTQAVFFDYDHDGKLDLFLLRHSVHFLKNYDVTYMKTAHDSLAGCRLYHNEGDHFTNVTDKAGIISNPISFGLGVAIADFDGDGWDDIYVTNDYDEDDYLYLNQHDGTFKESLRSFMGHTSKYSMGCDVGDINNDGIPDLITVDMLPESNRRQKMLKGPDGYDHFQNLIDHGYYYQYMRNMLQIGGRYGDKVRYSEIGQLAGISNTDWSWCPLFADFDLDGYQDLFITNGFMRDFTNMDFLKYIAPSEIQKARDQGKPPDLYGLVLKMPSSQVKSYLFRNKGNLQFENVSAAWGMDQPSLSNGAAYADLDNDGDLDLVVNNINQPAFIWQNHAEDLKHHYLKFRFSGLGMNRFGVGAKVLVEAPDGFKQLQEMIPVHGFESSSDYCLIFGLGSRDSVKVTVTWNSGAKEVLPSVGSNQTVVLEESKAAPAPATAVNSAPSYFSAEPAPTFLHAEDDYNDFKREPLLPHQYSHNGPALAIGDLDGDGRPDVFVSGGKGQGAAVLLNRSAGQFAEVHPPALDSDALFEGVDATIADFDGDGHPDLYVVSGGNEANFQDHIYFGDGQGQLHSRPGVLPPTNSSGGAVVAFDMDGDGDLDIFRSGQVTTGAYPKSPQSFLFRNDKGVFTDVTPAFLSHLGMICAVKVADMNKDGIPDLILAGEFMPITILYGSRNPPYFSEDHKREIPLSSGWWNCLEIADVNGDGIPDILAGNQGLNGQMKPTPDEPVTVDATDLDNNGSMDAIISYFIQGKSYPVATRDELLDQVPSFKTKFPTYQSYCEATVKDIFTPQQWASAIHLRAEEFRSGVFLSRGAPGAGGSGGAAGAAGAGGLGGVSGAAGAPGAGGLGADSIGYTFQPFPIEGQAFPVRAMLCGYFRGQTTGPKDLLLAGNNFAVRAQWGRQDAGKGLLLRMRPGESAQVTTQQNTQPTGAAPLTFEVIPGAGGFYADKDVRKMVQIGQFIIVANNNDSLQIFKVN
jgi:enediyne biosynthesis protein E4